MPDYTPTTDQIREEYAHNMSPVISRTGRAESVQAFRGRFDRWLTSHDAQVAAQALRDAVRYARPDAGDHVGMTRSEAEAFEDALTLVEEYADRIEAQGVEG